MGSRSDHLFQTMSAAERRSEPVGYNFLPRDRDQQFPIGTEPPPLAIGSRLALNPPLSPVQ